MKKDLSKNLSSKEWSLLREKTWLKINKIFEEQNSKYERLIDFDKIKQDIMNKLIVDFKEFKDLSDRYREYFNSSIIAIYLLRTGKYQSQNEIVKKSGFAGRWHIEAIRKCLKFNLKESIYSSLFFDKKQRLKECSECRKILPFKKFSGRSRKCNDCRNVKNMINYHQKKLAVAIFITLKQNREILIDDFLDLIKMEEKFYLEIKCKECGLNVNYLPALEFHHPSIKSDMWDKLRSRPIDAIIKTLNKEESVLICSNCHKVLHSKYFNKNKREIISELNRNITRNRALIRLKMKRIILEELYGGVCSHCRVADFKVLPAIQFHHPDLKKIGWHRLRNYKDLDYIKHKLISENCIALCANCHRMEEAILFNSHKDEILSKYLLHY